MVEIAEAWGVEPVDALLRLLEEEDASVGYIGHGMSPENVEMVLRHPLVMIGSDGYAHGPGRARPRRRGRTRARTAPFPACSATTAASAGSSTCPRPCAR